MNFRVSCELGYNLNSPATFLFALKCLETGGQKISSESLATTPEVGVEEFQIESGMNRFCRMLTHNPGTIGIRYTADVSTSSKIVDVSKLSLKGTAELNPEGIPFLFPSRYCQSDRMREQANAIFGHIVGPLPIASAVSDWIYENIAYVSGSSVETSSAMDTMEHKQGVCRDFAHLGITLCRALNVPARYVSAYSYQLNPPDFHACFEVFVNGWWYVFDPTRLAPLNGLVRIATGRDAADAAVCTIFGDPVLTKSVVSCEFLGSDFQAVTRDTLVGANQAIALL
jgi:transglutaminase-like putative cysteine protease